MGKSEEVFNELTDTQLCISDPIKEEVMQFNEEAVSTLNNKECSVANTNQEEQQKDLNFVQTKYNIVAVQSSVAVKKKNSKFLKKSKHKNYEKPCDQAIKHFKCTQCPKVFKGISNFNSHQRSHNPRPLSCQICKNTFHFHCQLKEHARVHTGERPFKCHSCSKTFARKSCLVAHMVIHSALRPFQCDVCSKRFGRKYNLSKHLQSHSENKPHQCLHCSRQFKCKKSLQKHQMVHKLRIYSCSVCKETFDSKRRLTHHSINEHVTYRPFTCTICQQQFIFKSQLTHHFREHDTEKPYSCFRCKKSYLKKGHLIAHIKQYCNSSIPLTEIKVEVLT